MEEETFPSPIDPEVIVSAPKEPNWEVLKGQVLLNKNQIPAHRMVVLVPNLERQWHLGEETGWTESKKQTFLNMLKEFDEALQGKLNTEDMKIRKVEQPVSSAITMMEVRNLNTNSLNGRIEQLGERWALKLKLELEYLKNCLSEANKSGWRSRKKNQAALEAYDSILQELGEAEYNKRKEIKNT